MNGHNSLDSFGAIRDLNVDSCSFKYYALDSLAGYGDVARLPFSLKVLLENLLRNEDGVAITREQILAVIEWLTECRSDREVQFTPHRILMQDFTGVPALVDLASMRDAVAEMGGDPGEINPSARVDLVIDHSVIVDEYASAAALKCNVLAEMERNQERYRFLKWAQGSFDNLRVVPPGTGICHQVNLEYLADVVCCENSWLFPDTLIGTDSHTTMINGLGVLGWGCGGIEAEAAMLGQPVSMALPEVVGVRLVGDLQEGVTATDLVLTITEILRKRNVVGKFVEFYGPSLAQLSLADRATIANMAPEYGATCSYFPIDEETIRYLTLTARDESLINRVEAYARANGLWHDNKLEAPLFSETVTIYLDLVETSVSGPKRPQDRSPLSHIKQAMFDYFNEAGENTLQAFDVPGEKYRLSAGDVVIAAITSCTNTSNPAVMMAAGLIAQKAVERGLEVKPWVKTSLAPGSQVVTDYLVQSGLQGYLDQLGFQLVGYGCTTCIGNSGPLDAKIAQLVEDNQLTVCSVLSGNRNFEGRIHAQVKANWLASPPLVVAFALAGTTLIDFGQDPIGVNHCGEDIYLRDIWPTNDEIEHSLAFIRQKFFRDRYASVFKGDQKWLSLPDITGSIYPWNPESSYIKRVPFFDLGSEMTALADDINGARILSLLGDTITTDHISPAGQIHVDGAAGQYLRDKGVSPNGFNSFGARRGNHEVMVRGTFSNSRLMNKMLDGKTGGFTIHVPSGVQMNIYEAAMRYHTEKTPLVIFAGKEYGTGSSRDWAAKGTRLLGVKAVIAESFERIHRTNLIGMGVLPIELAEAAFRKLRLRGDETISVLGIGQLAVNLPLTLVVDKPDSGERISVQATARIDTNTELKYLQAGGILNYVLNQSVVKMAAHVIA